MSFPPAPRPHVRPGAVPSGPPAAILGPSGAGGASNPAPHTLWGIRLGVVIGLLTAVGGAGAGLRAYYLPTTFVTPGLAIDDEGVPVWLTH